MLSRVRIEGRARPPRVVNPYIRAPAPTCTYDGRTSRPIPTSPPVSVRTDRGVTVPARGSDGRARRTRRPANPCTCRARSMTLILLWRTPKISGQSSTSEVVSQHANAADVTTAQRGVPLQALQARAPTTIRPAAVDPLTAPRVVTSRPNPLPWSCARLPRYAQTPADGRALHLVFCCFRKRFEPTRVQFRSVLGARLHVEPTDWSCGDERRASRRRRRAAAPGPVGQPGAVLFEQGVGQQEELAHDGGQSDLRRLPQAAELAVLRTQARVATDRRQGRHVEKPPQGAFPISRSRAHTHRRHGHPLQTVPSAGLIERPQEKNRVDALR